MHEILPIGFLKEFNKINEKIKLIEGKCITVEDNTFVNYKILSQLGTHKLILGIYGNKKIQRTKIVTYRF